VRNSDSRAASPSAQRRGSSQVHTSHNKSSSKKVAGACANAAPYNPHGNMPFRTAVLFDLDGTLVDTERDNVESVVLAASDAGRSS